MTAPDAKPTATTNDARRRRPAKVMFQGVEILRPAVSPDTPLPRLRRAAKIAVKQYADELAASKQT